MKYHDIQRWRSSLDNVQATILSGGRVHTLGNGREARIRADGQWEVQPWNDNYWHAFPSLKDAVIWAAPAGVWTGET